MKEIEKKEKKTAKDKPNEQKQIAAKVADKNNQTPLADTEFESVTLEEAGFDADKPIITVAAKNPGGFWRCGLHFTHRSARMFNVVDDNQLPTSGVSECQLEISDTVAERLLAEPNLHAEWLEEA